MAYHSGDRLDKLGLAVGRAVGAGGAVGKVKAEDGDGRVVGDEACGDGGEERRVFGATCRVCEDKEGGDEVRRRKTITRQPLALSLAPV